MAGIAKPWSPFVRLSIGVWMAAAGWPLAGQPPDVPAAPPNQPEIGIREEKTTFTSHVTLVMVPVVVRDKQGKVVAGLTKNQFRLFDKGKPQEIDRFSVEEPASRPLPAQPPAEPQPPGEAAAAPGPALIAPQRFVGYLFDDVHADAADLMRARDAAGRHIESQLKPTDRAAIFTTSGQGTVDFTDDRNQLHEGLARLMPHPIARSASQECPDIGFLQADLMVNKNDQQALYAAATETGYCQSIFNPFASPAVQAQEFQIAQRIALGAAGAVLSTGEQGAQVSLAVIKSAVRRMSAMPGERVLVLVSPGFLTLADHQPDEFDVIEYALRANVIINVLNLRGVYTTNMDASRTIVDSRAEQIKQDLKHQSEMAQESLLTEVAADTGGIYFHNNNNLDQGFRETASGPELYYLLGFQPQNLKLDGSFHGLKVAIESKTGYAIEARRGYYAPTRLEDAAATARREIEDAVYSREEMSDLPVQLHTQFFKGAGGAATVTVLAHVGVTGLKFRKENDRNLDTVTVVTALFDRNGKIVAGAVKHVDLRLRDDSLQHRLGQGLTVRISLEAATGAYVVRLVVRDVEGQLMSAVNGTVEIP